MTGGMTGGITGGIKGGMTGGIAGGNAVDIICGRMYAAVVARGCKLLAAGFDVCGYCGCVV